MNHSNLYLAYLANESMEQSGIDALKDCFDKHFFINYPNEISYSYNSRGFRDDEWPADNDLKDCTWCLGDSFTVGIGQPLKETWPQLLQAKTRNRVINISMDGASNTWLARKARYIIENISPALIVIQWSYLPRRELADESLPDNERRLSHALVRGNASNSEYKDFVKCFLDVETHKENTEVVHTFVPRWNGNESFRVIEEDGFWNTLVDYNKLKGVKEAINSTQLDFARDSFHYGLKTSTRYIKDILQLLQL